uniref:lysozyme n=1 Tax=Plectus sambesii TaxID=2011161 RepID=A0A914WFQ4_9BILA
MPVSARNTLLASIQTRPTDDQSVLYVIDYSNDGGQIAISVEDFKEIASNYSYRSTSDYEELSFENIAQKTRELSSASRHAHNLSTGYQPQSTASDGYTEVLEPVTNGKTVPPNLMAAFRHNLSYQVHPSVTHVKSFNGSRPAPPLGDPSSNLRDEEEGGYVNCKRRFSRDVLLPFWRRRSKYSQCIIILAVLFLICIVIAGALAAVFWTKGSEPPASPPYEPPQGYIARCLNAVCFVETQCDPEIAVNGIRDDYARGCKNDGTSEGCGWYMIHQPYFQDCFKADPGIINDWRDCARDYNCSTRCVHQYYRAYEQSCPDDMDKCECLTRNHVGGPTGYKRNYTLDSWKEVKKILENDTRNHALDNWESMLSEQPTDLAKNSTSDETALKPPLSCAPAFSVSYGTVDAGIFLQEGNEVKYASFDRAGEIVANMPDSARNTLLAPIQQGLIDAQSVFYLVDYSNDGGQIAISVEDFVELACNCSNRPTVYEELSEDTAEKAKDTSNSLELEEKCFSNDGITVPPRLLDALRQMSNLQVHYPPMVSALPSSNRTKPSEQESTIPTTNDDDYEYDIYERPWQCLRRCDHFRRRHRRFTVTTVLLIFFGIAVAGASVFWIFPSSQSPTIQPEVHTTTEYQPPQNSTARCIKALCNATSGYCQSDEAINYHEEGSQRGCRNDGAAEGESDGCGWYLLHKSYHIDCSEKDPGILKDWRECALNYECATRCVTQYYRRYRSQCPESMDKCECLIRNHVGGPNGYKKSTTDASWEKVKAMLEKN